MDVLNPDLVWIDGVCCRVGSVSDGLKRIQITDNDLDKPMHTYEAEGCDDDEESDEDIYTKLSNGRVKASVGVAQCFIGYVIGTKGATKKRIENETRTDIKIPPRGQSGDVTITGSDRKNVSRALRRIKLIILGARQKQGITHFLSIPTNSEQIKENFNKFKDEILTSPWGENINPEIFIKPDKLHITLLVMFLADEAERNIAKDTFENCKSAVIMKHFEGIKNVSLSLKGVSYMNDDPKAVNVLYAEVVEHGLNLTELCIKLTDAFNKTGFLVCASRNIKLHVTLMNTKNLMNADESKKSFKRTTFDASNILEKYKDFDFGSQTFNEIHLSLSSSTADNGYYQSTHIVTLQ